jgi:SprT protein
MPRVLVRFDLRGCNAGMASFTPGGPPEIRYNRTLLAENPDGFVARTVPHEVAHVVARTLFGATIRPHGTEWKALMSWFGAEASRCHDYDVTRAQIRRLQRFLYRCACRRHWLTSIRHNRALAGQTYYCRACKQPLELADQEPADLR